MLRDYFLKGFSELMKENFWRQYFTYMPRGLYGLIILQLLTLLIYSAVFSCAAFYLKQYFSFSVEMIRDFFMAFVSLTFIFHAFAGFIAGRLFNLRQLLVICFAASFVGTVLMSIQNLSCVYWGICFLLSGMGIGSAIINCLIIQLFKPEDKRREIAFIWTFAAINIGFLSAYLLKDFIQSLTEYKFLFYSLSILSLSGITLIMFHWRKFYDRSTYILGCVKQKVVLLNSIGTVLLLMCLQLTFWFMTHPLSAHYFMIVFCLAILIFILIMAFLQPSRLARNKVFAYFVYLLVSLAFWVISMFIPSEIGYILHSSYHQATTNLDVYSNWYELVTSATVILFAPLLGALFFKLRLKGFNITISIKFALGMLCLGIAVITMPLSIHPSMNGHYLGGSWLILTYAFGGLAQLLIQPTGLAMVGQLAPVAIQSILMGCWMMVLGIAASITHYFSNWLHTKNVITPPNVTIKHYQAAYHLLGWSAISVALLVLLLLPLLSKLVRYRSLNPALNNNKVNDNV